MKLSILLLLTAVAIAQTPTGAKTKGIVYAGDYDYQPIKVYQGNSATGSQSIKLVTGTITLPDGRTISPFATNAPITIGGGTEQETVTPSAVSGCGLGQPIGSCTITATFSQIHSTASTVKSGDNGLQEALNDAATLHAVVIDENGNIASANTWIGAQNLFLPSTNTTCAPGIPGALFCTFSDNSTFLYLTGRNGLYSLILDSDTDGAGDVSSGGSATGLEFCGNGCGTSSQIFIFPQGTATNSVNFSGMGLFQVGDYWDGAAAHFDEWVQQDVVTGTGTNPQTNFVFSHSGTTGFSAYSFLNSPVQINDTNNEGHNERLGVLANSGNPAINVYDHNHAQVLSIGEHGTLAINNCSAGGASGTASPAACGSSPVGMVAVPASQTSYTVNTTGVFTASEVFIEQMSDNSGLSGSPSCSSTAANPMQSARVSGTSFTFTLTSVAAVTCFKYWIVN